MYKDKERADSRPMSTTTGIPASLRFQPTPRYGARLAVCPRVWTRLGSIAVVLTVLLLWTLWGHPNARYPLSLSRQTCSRHAGPEDTFAGYKYRDSGCEVSPAELYQTNGEVCRGKDVTLAAMSSGGRVGRDAPYMTRGCDMQWFSTTEACEILGRFSQVVLVGDSMLRHIMGAINILVREDLGYGGVTDWNFNLDERRQCFCNNQFDVKSCSVQGIYSTADVLRHDPSSLKCSSLVPGWSTDLRIEEIVRYPIPEEERQRLDAAVAYNPAKPAAYVLGHGLWNDLNIDTCLAWLGSVMDIVDPQRRGVGWAAGGSMRSILLVTPNAAGEKKPDEWLVSQGNKALVRFEQRMALEAASRGIDHLGTWNMSIQARLYDGVHMDMRGNLVKAMMVLNWLAAL